MKKFRPLFKDLRSQLEKHDKWNPETQKAWELLSAEAEGLPEAASKSGPLPPPQELHNHAQGMAIYTDGACRGNPGPGAWAAVSQNAQGEVIFQTQGFDTLTTNNRMEISGVIHGFLGWREYIMNHPMNQYSPVFLFTDSKYVVDGVNQWIDGWKARGWKKADGKTPENLELWQELAILRDEFPAIKVAWVKGHNGHPQNEHCDQLANQLLDNEGY